MAVPAQQFVVPGIDFCNLREVPLNGVILQAQNDGDSTFGNWHEGCEHLGRACMKKPDRVLQNILPWPLFQSGGVDVVYELSFLVNHADSSGNARFRNAQHAHSSPSARRSQSAGQDRKSAQRFKEKGEDI